MDPSGHCSTQSCRCVAHMVSFVTAGGGVAVGTVTGGGEEAAGDDAAVAAAGDAVGALEEAPEPWTQAHEEEMDNPCSWQSNFTTLPVGHDAWHCNWEASVVGGYER